MKKLLLAVLLFAMPVFASDFVVPELNNPVNDYAGVLTSSGKERIAEEIVKLKQETGAQAGVLIIDTLDGNSIEEVSMQAARKWRLGSKERDDGILLLVAVKDHKMRIEVGQGLEGIVTDLHSRHITENMKTFLRSKDFDGAVLQGISGISERIKAHADEITTKTLPPEEDSNGFLYGVLFVIISGLLAGVYFQNRNRKREEARRFARQPLTPDQAKLARLMNQDLKTQMKKNPIVREKDNDDSFTTGLVVGSMLNSHSSSNDSYSSSSSDSGSSSSSSDWGGGGGDFSGGGSSDSW